MYRSEIDRRRARFYSGKNKLLAGRQFGSRLCEPMRPDDRFVGRPRCVATAPASTTAHSWPLRQNAPVDMNTDPAAATAADKAVTATCWTSI